MWSRLLAPPQTLAVSAPLLCMRAGLLLALGFYNLNPLSVSGVDGLLFPNPATVVPVLGGTQGSGGSLSLAVPLANPALHRLEATLQALGPDTSGRVPGSHFTSTEAIRT